MKVALLISRLLAAVALAVGVVITLGFFMAGMSLPDGFLLVWIAAFELRDVALGLALVAVFGVCVARRRLDGVGLALVVLGSGLAYLPAAAPIVGGPAPPLDATLLEFAIALLVFLYLFRHLPDRLTWAVFGLFFVVLLGALEASAAGAASRDGRALAQLDVAVIDVVVLATAILLLPRSRWHRPTRFGPVPALLAWAGAGALVLVGVFGPPAAAVLLLETIAVAIAVVLSLHVRVPIRNVGRADIDRPPERVFKELTDFRSPVPEASPHRLRVVGDGPMGVGSRLEGCVDDYRGLTFRVTAFEPASLFAYELEPWSWGMRVRYGIEPTEGGARVSWRVDNDVPLYWVIQPSYLKRARGAREETAARLRAGKPFASDQA